VEGSSPAGPVPGPSPVVPTSVPDGGGAAAAASPVVASQPQTAVSGEEQALAAAKDAALKAAPWQKGMSPTVVLAEGIILAVIGAIVWLAPGLGARALIDLVALVLLVTATLSALRVLRDQVPPNQVASVAFRAGVGLSIGLLIVLGSLIADNNDATTLAVAVTLGIGLVLYALGALMPLLQREPGSRFPIARLVIAVLTLLLGLGLVLSARSGLDSVNHSFALLGVFILIVGLALAGYGFYLRSQVKTEPD
jgi:hypothetical protein